MKNFSDVIIIGGGASGMMAAIAASDGTKNVQILEHMDRLGKKILLTGNGRCNLTNHVMSKECYGSETADFAMQVIRDFDEKAVIRFFREAGILIHERNGYVYPNTDQASTINEVLRLELLKHHVRSHTGLEILRIKKNETEGFTVETSRGNFTCKSLILATGSRAYPKTGSDGSGYLLAKSMGHTIVEPLPALTSLHCNSKLLKQASGVRCDGIVRLFIEKEEKEAVRGEIQITDYGISGIPVFQVSRHAVRALSQNQKVFCSLDLLPDYTEKDIFVLLRKKFFEGNALEEKLSLEDVVSGMVHKKLSGVVLKDIGYSPTDGISSMKDKDLQKLSHAFKNFSFELTGYHSFDYGQVCQGGVNVREINAETMESKLVKGLYFAGELVDVDGICGGYNLQWAWSSGYKAGKAAIQ